MLHSFNAILIFIYKELFLCILFISIINGVTGQTTIVKDSAIIPGTTVIIAGKHYQRSGLHTFFWGTHYRKEWSTPVRVNNLYLDTVKGGLIPTQEGGSRQSKGLRLKNKAGKEFVLRSIDKDFGNGLPDMFHGTFISRVAKDQASISYPFAAITIPGMAEAAGIYHTNPVIAFVPQQPVLGEYNNEYGNQLYLLEERPDDNQEDVASFGNAKNVIGTEKVFEKIYADNDNSVDQKAFVRARLFDMFIGDWGRHGDQWRWAEFEDEKQTVYKPIPRDRDQAYTRINGMFPNLAATSLKQIQGFNYDIKKISKWNFAGRKLDPRFTNELHREIWLQQAKELQEKLTDDVIEKNIRLLPSQHFDISGSAIIAKLKSRREHLMEYANTYYTYLSRNVDLPGSDERELYEINRISDAETQINIYKINKENEVKNKPYYTRIFKPAETKEIRIYSLDQADKITEKGNMGKGVLIRIIDPHSTDSILTKRSSKLKISRGDKYEFDTAHEKKLHISILPLLNHQQYRVFDNDLFYLFPRTGLKISLNILYAPKPWKKDKYESKHLVSANYGFVRQATNIGYVGIFPQLIGSWDGILKARADIPAIENFHGTGNETIDDINTRNYYRTSSTRMFAAAGIKKDFGKFHHIELTGMYQSVKVERTSGKFISSIPLPVNLSQFSPKYFAGSEAAYTYHAVNNPIFPTKGIHFALGGLYLANLKKSNTSFTNLKSNFAFYLPLSRQFSIAARAGGEFLSGEADFYHLNKLKGNTNLRGYNRERFYGKSAFYNNNEIRWAADTKNFLFTGKIGLIGFYDVGRVWQPLEKSTKWHTGYGGGFFIVPFNKIAVSTTYDFSEEGPFLQLRIGMFF